VLGFALNDSGIAVPGVIVGVSAASLVTLLVAVREGGGAARVPAHVHTTAFERTAPVGSRV
jgi:hypothetical protein